MLNRKKAAVLLSVLAVSMMFIPSGCDNDGSSAETKSSVVSEVSELKEIRQGGTNVVISASDGHLAGVTPYGTVLAKGAPYKKIINGSDPAWTDVVAVSVGDAHLLGVKKDGTVCVHKDYEGYGTFDKDGNFEYIENNFPACEVSDWKDISALSAGGNFTVGCKKDGTVVVTPIEKSNDDYQVVLDVSEWKDIVSVSAGLHHVVGLKKDGTVVAGGDTSYGRCNVSEWKDIVAVSAAFDFTVGVRSDGTVVAAGRIPCNASEIKELSGISAIAASTYNIFALRTDGTVIALGTNEYGQCNVSEWKDIVAITTGGRNIFAVRSDGSVIGAGKDSNSLVNEDWVLKTPDNKEI